MQTRSLHHLRNLAQQIAHNAYSPYSQAKVGCSVEMDSGKTFVGCNIENSSYGATVCAERVAIFTAIASGEKKIKAIYIYTHEGWPPCGMCRQVMSEFASEHLVVTIGNAKGEEKSYSFSEIYPFSFTPKYLGK